MNKLPDEIVCTIFGFLDGSHFGRLSFVSRRFYELSFEVNDFSLDLKTVRSQDNLQPYIEYLKPRLLNVHIMYAVVDSTYFDLFSRLLKPIRRLQEVTLRCIMVPERPKALYFNSTNIMLIYKIPTAEDEIDFETCTW